MVVDGPGRRGGRGPVRRSAAARGRMTTRGAGWRPATRRGSARACCSKSSRTAPTCTRSTDCSHVTVRGSAGVLPRVRRAAAARRRGDGLLHRHARERPAAARRARGRRGRDDRRAADREGLGAGRVIVGRPPHAAKKLQAGGETPRMRRAVDTRLDAVEAAQARALIAQQRVPVAKERVAQPPRTSRTRRRRTISTSIARGVVAVAGSWPVPGLRAGGRRRRVAGGCGAVETALAGPTGTARTIHGGAGGAAVLQRKRPRRWPGRRTLASGPPRSPLGPSGGDPQSPPASLRPRADEIGPA